MKTSILNRRLPEVSPSSPKVSSLVAKSFNNVRSYFLLCAVSLVCAGQVLAQPIEATFTVSKSYSDGTTTTPVSILLTCTDGTIVDDTLDAAPGSPAEFLVQSFDPEASPEVTCTATEVEDPIGFTADDSACSEVSLQGVGGCTIVNTLNSADFTVNKTYSDGTTTTPVEITLTCTSGTILDDTLDAAPGSPAVFTVQGYDSTLAPAVTCTATEATPPVGFTADESACSEVDLVATGSCDMANNVNTGTFTINKVYSDGMDIPVEVTLSCDAPAVVDNNPQMASPSAPAVFDVSYVTEGDTTCSATEVPADGYTPDASDCNDGDFINSGCSITNTFVDRAEFTVLKDFTDDNPGEVTVSLDCNTGLILDQDKEISEDGIGVTFIVTDYTSGSLDCNVTETLAVGYSANFQASGDSTFTDSDDGEDGCYFTDVAGDAQNTCVVTNDPDEVEVVINKEWLYPGSSTSEEVSSEFTVVLICENASIASGYEGYCGTLAAPEAPQGDGAVWCQILEGSGDSSIPVLVKPYAFPGGSCYAVEVDVDDAVEVENGCATSIPVSIGQGGSCAIINTVFFEGIPALNQYGMALMVLMLLALGFIAVPRLS